MSVRRHLIPLALAVFAARCADGPHPTGVQQPLAPAPHFLRWAGGSAPQLTTIGTGSGGAGHGVFLASPGGLSLDQYTATFWAVRGEERSLQINYFSVTGDTSSPFLRLVVDDPAYVPGLGDLAPGDSVLMTVTIDPSNIKVTLEPTGLLFGNPAQLQVWYGSSPRPDTTPRSSNTSARKNEASSRTRRPSRCCTEPRRRGWGATTKDCGGSIWRWTRRAGGTSRRSRVRPSTRGARSLWSADGSTRQRTTSPRPSCPRAGTAISR